MSWKTKIRVHRTPSPSSRRIPVTAGLAAALLFTGLMPAGDAHAQGRSVDFLTSQRSSDDPLDIALNYLRSIRSARGLETGDIDALTLTDRYRSAHNGVTHLYLRQTYRGIPVINSAIAVNIAKDGRVINANGRIVGHIGDRVNSLQARLDPADAIQRAALNIGLRPRQTLRRLSESRAATQDMRFSGGDISLDDIDVALRFYAADDDAGVRRARLAWQLDIRTPDQSAWYRLWVDADTGDVLGKGNMIASDTYEVFPLPLENPDEGSREVLIDPAETFASPFGWHDINGTPGAEFTDTRGNNVFAQEDHDANNSGGTRPDGGPTLDFLLPLDLNDEPESYTDFAIANLFYWNNIVHDIMYQYGFDEASGNFQVNNYGSGGAGGDPVQADAQDGSGTNNANFATPPDGSAPRMQMFVWTGGLPNELQVLTGGAAGTYPITSAAFGPELTDTPLTGNLVLAEDGTGDDVNDGCEPLTNGAAIAGNIAVIPRGTCSFVTKVRSAQDAGASGVVIVNNAPGSTISLGDDGTGSDITIPSGMISLDDGTAIISTLPVAAALISGPDVPSRDSDLDAGIIIHEYGHGISNRLTGGPSNTSCLFNTEQMGEGWSDWYALALTGVPSDAPEIPRGIGTYVIFEPTDGAGIRTFPYTTDTSINPFTYADIATESVPHGVGSVWATMLWDMYWALVDEYGFDPDVYTGTGGNNLAIQLVTDGMKLQPCLPGFVDGRDAILLADQLNNDGANQCLIWEVFAQRGLGFSASQGSANRVDDGVEAFDLPPECGEPGDQELTISAPTPGTAGVESCYEISGATPGNEIDLIVGLRAGSFQISGCDEPTAMNRPFFRDTQTADADGNATLCTTLGSNVSGRNVLAQAVDRDTAGCEISNVDITRY